MSDRLLTVDEFASATRQHPETVRRQIRRGAVATVRTGHKYLIPASLATTPTMTTTLESQTATTRATPQGRAEAILEALRSGDKTRRNAAIIQLAKSDAATIELVEDAIEAAEAAYDGPQDDLSDWRALDSEPFHFPEEPADYLTGLYTSDKAAGERH